MSALNLARAGGRALGAVGDVSPTVRRVGMQAGAVGLVAAGGAVTGWLAAGSKRGAAIGACAHVGLFALTGAFFGEGRLTTGERVFSGLLGLGGVAGAAYLHFGRSRR